MGEAIRILVIDDSEDDRLLYKRLLRKGVDVSYDVIEAGSGEDGLAAIEQTSPACILLDYSLPGHDGIEVLKRIRAKHPFLPVVMLTGQGNEKVAVSAMREGAQNYIAKASLTPADIQHAIQVAIGNCALEKRVSISEQEVIRERDTAQRYLDVAGVMILVLDTDANVKLINRHGCNLVGYSDPAEVIGKPWIDVFVPERIRDTIHQSWRRLVGGEEAVIKYYANPIVTKTGEERVIAWHSAVLTDEKGRVTGSLSSGEDITDRLRVEEKLRSSEERLRSIFSGVSEGILILDAATGTFSEVNEAAANMYGYTPEEMIGLDVNAISSQVPPYTQSDALKWIRRATATGETQHFDWHGKRRDGKLIWVEISIRLAHIGGRQVILSMARDVTARRAMEAQLRQALKMEAIGTLAGGVAHELNNLLQPIIMMTELVLTDLPAGSTHFEQLHRVVDAGGKAAEIVQRILAFGRADEVSHILLDMGFVAREAIAFIRTILPASITLNVDIDESAGQVRGDKTQLTQVLINLATNARDAIGANVGTVWVSLSKSHLEVETGTLKPGLYAVLKVRDTGAGMDKATAQRIFEPFFTTKGVGKGTGLGLSVTHGIITGHGGAILVDSAPGQGTTFSIYLPTRESDVALALTG